MENLDDAFFGENEMSNLVNRFEKMLEDGVACYYEVDQLEELLEHYLISNKLELANRVLEISKDQYPYNKQLSIKEAELLSMSNKHREALELLSDVENLEGFNPDFHLTKASILSHCGLYQKAIDSLHKAMNCTQDELDLIYLNLGIEHQNLEQYDLAIDYLQKSIEINPDNDDALYEIAYCYELNRNYEEAVITFNKVIDRAPYNVHAWFNLGASYQAIGELEKSLVAFDYAIVIDENFHAAYFNKATVLVKVERYAEAIELYKKALSFEILDSLIYFYIGDCYDNLDDYKNALVYFERALKKDDEMAEAWIGASSALDMLGRELEALEYAKKAVNLEPENGDYWCFLAGMQVKFDLPDDAIISFEQAIDNGYVFEDLFEDYTQLTLSIKNAELRQSVLERGLDLYPENKLLLIYQSVSHYLNKDEDQGFELLVDVLLQHPELIDQFILYYPKAIEREEIQYLVESMRKI